MTDLEITRACAEAMGLTLLVINDVIQQASAHSLYLDEKDSAGWTKVYDPLHDDAQAMALVKLFQLSVNHNCNGHGEKWVVQWFNDDDMDDEIEESAHDINRAICLCVARLRPLVSGKAGE